MARRAAIAAATCACAVLPAPAGASVTLEGPAIAVTDESGARALIERAPFRLSFEDASGRAVLRQVAVPVRAGGDVRVDNEGIGLDNAPELATYAPLAFQLGADRGSQHPGGLWTGNMIAGARAGVVHGATEVLEAERHGEGVALRLATTSPGHVMSVLVTPDEGSSFRVRASLPYAAGVAAFADAFESGPGEAFHGFGGRHNAIDQRGNDFYNWVEEEAFGAGPLQPLIDFTPGSGGERYLFPNGPTQAYYVQNLFVSSRPYGFLLNGTELSRWRMASDTDGAWQVSIRAPRLDYTVALGDGPAAIGALTAISGRHRPAPGWAIGPMLKRNVQQGNSDPERQRALITADVERMARGDVRVEAYSYESWDTLGDDFVRETNERLEELGIKQVGYVRAYVNDDGNFDPPGTFGTAVERGFCTRMPGGAPFIGVAVGPACLLDFTNPDTVAWWERRKIRRMLDLGFDGFMQDFGEQVVEDMRFHDGSTGVEMHNRYPILFHRTTREILDAWESQHPGRGEVWMYTRSGFSGRQGSAHWESSNFPGDETGDWQRSLGLPSLASDMLNRAVGGAYGFSTDIGGYFDSFTGTVPSYDELLHRWMEWSALTPHFRLHNSCCTNGTRMPWKDATTLERWNAQADLHVRARPYIRELWHEAVATGVPITRPLWLAFPDDAEAARQDQQWMLGEDVLVAPVVEQGATSRRVYFPAGCWQHGETGERFEGAGHREVAAPVGRLPWFERCGTDPIPAA